MALFSLQKSIQAKGKLNLVQSGRSKTKLKGWNSSIEGYRLLKWTILKSRIGHIWYVTYPTYYLYVSCQFRPSTLDLSQIVIILPIFYFSQQAKFLHCTTSYRIGIRKVQKNIATSSKNFEGAGNGEIKYEEQDFSNIISTTILQ